MNGTEREPIGNDLYGAFGRDFATKDGRRVMVAAITARQWKSLLDAIDGHEAMSHIEAMLDVDLSDEGQRFEARDVIAPVVARWVGARGYGEVRAAFDAAGVCWGPYQSFLEMVRDDSGRASPSRIVVAMSSRSKSLPSASASSRVAPSVAPHPKSGNATTNRPSSSRSISAG